MSTYRDDREALQYRADAATREAERLRDENVAIRAMVGRDKPVLLPTSLPPGAVYQMDVRVLPLAERARLAAHSVKTFPVWAIGILNVVTFGLFPLIHFGLLHNRLPRAAHNDPTAGKAIGYQFIPYYNLYWIFFSSMRLCDRITLQLRLRDRPETAPRGLLIAACIFTVIPYVSLIAIPVVWTIAACMLQARVNDVAKLAPNDWVATPSPYDQPGHTPSAYQPGKAQLAHDAKARRLVRWSNILGWGGFGLLVFGTIGGGILFDGAGAATAAIIAALCIVAGAIVGQVGRGMQGRAI